MRRIILMIKRWFGYGKKRKQDTPTMTMEEIMEWTKQYGKQ